MALTVTNILDLPYRIVGNQKETVHTAKFDSSYPEGGEALTVAQLGLNYLERADATITTVAKEVNIANAYYDEENEKLLLANETPAEIANESDVEGVIVTITARGH